jgi:transcriptional regulator with XRE-family HTH domain
MRLSEVRRANLILLLNDLFDGTQKRLVDRLGKGAAQISQWKSGHRSIHEDSARDIEAACGKPSGWLDVPHQSGHEGLTIRDSVAPAPFVMRPSLRVALEVLCEELARLEDPARLDGVAALLRSCAVASGDKDYIEPILTLMRFKAPPTMPKQNAA